MKIVFIATHYNTHEIDNNGNTAKQLNTTIMKNTDNTTQAVTVAQALKDGNSTTNQRIKDKFIDQNVNANVNSMVNYILSRVEDEEAPFTIEDVLNQWVYPEHNGVYATLNQGTEEERTEEIDRLRDMQSDLYDEIQKDPSKANSIEVDRDKIEGEINEIEALETEPQEIFEWWSVSSFLCEKLKDLGHPVLKDESSWGRCTTGQSIMLDYAITQICANMGILDGQESSWA